MKDLARIKLYEADHYIEDAVARVQRDDEYSPSVAVAHATDALILAVDVLCHEHNEPVSRRHDNASKVFLQLIHDKKIPESASQWRRLLAKAHAERTAIQYRGTMVSRAEARRFVREAQGFLAFVRSEVQP